ncbi:hypothetical protein BY996DRAFT_6539742 [Phakopsora pachyrhizi]|nr:hypothetical protein BY996DRAFT_6539742 [Phakopsora pachyrhizi]
MKSLPWLPEDRGHKEDGYGWSGGMAWKDDRWQWCRKSWIGDDGDIIRAGGGCGGRFGKGGAKSAPGACIGGVAVGGNGWLYWKEGQKLGGGAHQGQSSWSKITGATDL